jgi:TonB family protein
MRGTLFRLARVSVRLWTTVYTAGLPAVRRDVRLEEIESDLWEAQRDSHGDPARSSALHVFVRLLSGIPDDLGWRLEQVNVMTRTTRMTALVVMAGGMLAIWVGIASWMARPASLPAPSLRPLRARAAYPPPPPPPAVLRSPFGTPTRPIAFRYGETSYAAAGNMPLPKRIKDVRPVQAPIAVAAGVNGTVILEATIDETGRVVDTRILRSVPLLDQSAVDALRQWEFEPANVKGEAVPVTIRVTVDYKSQE